MYLVLAKESTTLSQNQLVSGGILNKKTGSFSGLICLAPLLCEILNRFKEDLRLLGDLEALFKEYGIRLGA
ncbi:hypothetical protein H8D57_04090 [bacterium]|nr:hypothetical protein [bacterium]